MRKYVFTVKDDICLANGKDVNATQIIDVMKTYGTVEDYDTHVAVIKKEYQDALDNVVAQNEAIKAQNLTELEVEVLNALRVYHGKAVKSYVDENERLTKTLDDVKAEHERTIEIIANVINKK